MAEETIVVDKARYAKLEAMEARQKLSARKVAVKTLIYVEKAKAANITVSKAEVNAYIAEEDRKKAAETAQA